MGNDLPTLTSALTPFPLLPLRDVVVFPHMVIPLFVGRPKSIKALDVAMETGKHILLVAQKSAAKDEPSAEDLYDIGSVATVLQMLKLPDGTVKVLVEGTQRARIVSIDDVGEYLSADATLLAASEGGTHEIEAMRRALLGQFDQYVKLNKKIPPEILTSMSGIDDGGRLADAITELKKLRMMSPMSAEATVVRNYIDTLLGLPWKKKSKINKDLGNAVKVLDTDHYGLEKVKERIVEYLAVQQRVERLKAPILCLVGAPGVGKTSLGQSIARATNRKFVRMAL